LAWAVALAAFGDGFTTAAAAAALAEPPAPLAAASLDLGAFGPPKNARMSIERECGLRFKC
jgi:hypothetical protein